MPDASADTRDDPPIPKALDLMAGPNAPVTCALRHCGWAVVPFDIKISEEHDLSKTSLQESLLREADTTDAVIVAMDCNTLSRIMEKPMPGTQTHHHR